MRLRSARGAGSPAGSPVGDVAGQASTSAEDTTLAVRGEGTIVDDKYAMGALLRQGSVTDDLTVDYSKGAQQAHMLQNNIRDIPRLREEERLFCEERRRSKVATVSMTTVPNSKNRLVAQDKLPSRDVLIRRGDVKLAVRVFLGHSAECKIMFCGDLERQYCVQGASYENIADANLDLVPVVSSWSQWCSLVPDYLQGTRACLHQATADEDALHPIDSECFPLALSLSQLKRAGGADAKSIQAAKLFVDLRYVTLRHDHLACLSNRPVSAASVLPWDELSPAFPPSLHLPRDGVLRAGSLFRSGPFYVFSIGDADFAALPCSSLSADGAPRPIFAVMPLSVMREDPALTLGTFSLPPERRLAFPPPATSANSANSEAGADEPTLRALRALTQLSDRTQTSGFFAFAASAAVSWATLPPSEPRLFTGLTLAMHALRYALLAPIRFGARHWVVVEVEQVAEMQAPRACSQSDPQAWQTVLQEDVPARKKQRASKASATAAILDFERGGRDMTVLTYRAPVGEFVILYDSDDDGDTVPAATVTGFVAWVPSRAHRDDLRRLFFFEARQRRGPLHVPGVLAETAADANSKLMVLAQEFFAWSWEVLLASHAEIGTALAAPRASANPPNAFERLALSWMLASFPRLSANVALYRYARTALVCGERVRWISTSLTQWDIRPEEIAAMGGGRAKPPSALGAYANAAELAHVASVLAHKDHDARARTFLSRAKKLAFTLPDAISLAIDDDREGRGGLAPLSDDMARSLPRLVCAVRCRGAADPAPDLRAADVLMAVGCGF